MEIIDKTYILGYWFASDGKNNWYCIICKEDGDWFGRQTFRYNVGDGDPFLGVDKKSIYTFSAPKDEPEDDVIQKIDTIFDFIKIKFNDFHDKFLVQGDIKKFFKIAESKPYLHIRREQ